MTRKLLFLPLVVFMLLGLALLWQLMRNADGDSPDFVESALKGQPMPAFQLSDLSGQTVTQKMLVTGKPHLLNVWATWCPTCRAEHAFLRQLSAQGVDIVGIDYKDDQTKARSWLNTLGSPYSVVALDKKGTLGMDLGVYGAPETFLIDGKGIIRWRFAGALTQEVWLDRLKPLLDHYTHKGGQ